MALQLIVRRRKSLCVLQFLFYSGVACLIPFLATHMKEIGLTTRQSAWINAISGLMSVIGPLFVVPLAHKYNKYQSLLVITTIMSGFLYTSLLFVPKVIRTAKEPSLHYDCTENVLRIEQCPDWEGQCESVPKSRAVGNETYFTLSDCKYACGTGASNGSWYPLHVCFLSESQGNLCLVDNQQHSDQDSNSAGGLPLGGIQMVSSGSEDSRFIEFSSRFDRWPVVRSEPNIVWNQKTEMCVFKPKPPLIVNDRSFDSIVCRPPARQCHVHCSVSMFFKRHSGNHWTLRSAVPCYELLGDVHATFYSYLILRCCADWAFFTAFCLLDVLSITLTNSFDNLYGGFARVVSIAVPLSVWSALTGFMIDYYSELTKVADYAPSFIIFDGMMLIFAALAIALPVYPINSGLRGSQSQTSLKSNPSNRRNDDEDIPLRIPRKSKWILGLMFPVVLLLGIQWGVMETFLRPFYLQMNTSKLWIGLTYTITFVAFVPFALVVKSLTSAVGRAHLVALAFVFYALRLSGISLLLNPKWTLFPFEAMEAFTLPIAWIGVTSFSHDLIQRSTRLVEMKTGFSSCTCRHVKLHLSLLAIHFGLGRSLGSALWALWDWRWVDDSDLWRWLNEDQTQFYDMYTNDFRVLLRLMALVSLVCAALFFLIYHLFCTDRRWKTKKSKRGQPPTQATNGIQYCRLNDKPIYQNSSNGTKKAANGKTNVKMTSVSESPSQL